MQLSHWLGLLTYAIFYQVRAGHEAAPVRIRNSVILKKKTQ